MLSASSAPDAPNPFLSEEEVAEQDLSFSTLSLIEPVPDYTYRAVFYLRNSARHPCFPWHELPEERLFAFLRTDSYQKASNLVHRVERFVRLILAVHRINPEVTVHCDIQVVFLPRQTFWILRLDLLDYDHRTLLLHQDYSYIDADLHFSWFPSHYFLIDHLHEATPFILSEALPQLEEYAETVNTLREEFA